MSELLQERRDARFDIVMPSLRGKIAMVTGATDGIGKAIAFRLLDAGAQVIIPGRNAIKTERAAESLRQLVPNAHVEVRPLNLSAPESIADLTSALVEDGRPIHLLILNAGIMMSQATTRPSAPNGEELHWQTNYLGHRQLTEGLLPLLIEGNARVVAQLSLAARFAKLPPPPAPEKYRPMPNYGASKLALAVYMTMLERRSREERTGVTTALCHPGFARTNIIDGPKTPLERLRSRLVNRARLLSTGYEAALPSLLASTAAWLPGSIAVPGNSLRTSGAPTITKAFSSIERAAAVPSNSNVPAQAVSHN